MVHEMFLDQAMEVFIVGVEKQLHDWHSNWRRMPSANIFIHYKILNFH